MSPFTPGVPFGIQSVSGFSPYPSYSALDLLFLSIAVWVVFGVLWSLLYLPFRVLPTTIVLITIAGLLILATPFEPWLFVATLGGGSIGYICTRRRPVLKIPLVMQNLINQPPLGDVEFDQWANRVLDIARSSAYETYLTSGWITRPEKLHIQFVGASCAMYRHSVTWSLISASCFFFVYSLAYLTMPLGLQVLVVAAMAVACSMQVGLLAKRRSAEKQIARMEGEVF